MQRKQLQLQQPLASDCIISSHRAPYMQARCAEHLDDPVRLSGDFIVKVVAIARRKTRKHCQARAPQR